MRKLIYIFVVFVVGLAISLGAYGQNWVYMYNSAYGETPTLAEKSIDVGITDPIQNPDYRDLTISGFSPRKFKTPYLLDKETGVGIVLLEGETVAEAKSRFDAVYGQQAPDKKATKDRKEKTKYKKLTEKELIRLLILEVYGVDRDSL